MKEQIKMDKKNQNPATIECRTDTIPHMLHIFSSIKMNEDRQVIKAKLENLFSHPDYQVEFNRYARIANLLNIENPVTQPDLIEFILNLPTIKPEEITNNSFKARYKHFALLLNQISEFMGKMDYIDKIFTDEVLQQQTKLALKGLPKNVQIGEIVFLFTIGIGISFGYPHVSPEKTQYIHFDFIQLLTDITAEQIQYIMGHEIHHIGFSQFTKNLEIEESKLEELFVYYFSGEGLAVKYCNNAVGVLSKNIYPDLPENIGLDAFSWQYLNDDFENTFDTFKKHIHMIRTGEIKNKEAVKKILNDYWFNTEVENQDSSDIPDLKYGRLYSFGNELWGTIHDVFGKEKVYELLYDLKSVIPTFNDAVVQLKKEKYQVR